MKYVSVTGRSPEVGFVAALFGGLAPDGGLYVPAQMPHLPGNFINRPDHTLQSIGAEIASLFIDEIPSEELARIIDGAWQFPIPLVRLDENLYVLELFHGPTLAFKDVGAKFMARVMSYVLQRQEREVAILVATSGDTGSAVAHGFYHAPKISVYVLYPSGQVSPLQERQMTTLGDNVHALEVDGTFDDCQRMVKGAFADAELSRRRALTTANSINVARLVPQIAYYGWGVRQLQSAMGEHFTAPLIVVPSGNFGNLTAGVYAKAIGIPIASFLAVTNANDVVPAYLHSGEFHPRPSVRTLSNAMDVGNPSNLARLQNFYGTADAMRAEIASAAISDDETLRQIAAVHSRYGYLADPHTAVALAGYERLPAAARRGRPAIVVSTAHPAKFREVISKAIGIEVPLPAALSEALKKPTLSMKIKAEAEALRGILEGA